MTKLSHIDQNGKAAMVDISGKDVTRRTAKASGTVKMKPDTVAMVREHRTPKGDPLEPARLAGILAAKQTSALVPLCHPLLIEHIDVITELRDDGVHLNSIVVTTGKTGAEMEALTAVSVAALTVYDMCKAVDKEMIITDLQLEEKSGGKSGHFIRNQC